MRVSLATDPGRKGAIFIEYLDKPENDSDRYLFIDLSDVFYESGVLNGKKLRDILKPALVSYALEDVHIALELVKGFNKTREKEDGTKSAAFSASNMFNFGGGFRGIENLIIGMGFDNIQFYDPNVWKAQYPYKKRSNKKESVDIALKLCPLLYPWLKLKKDHDRAEAFLLARLNQRIIAAKNTPIEEVRTPCTSY